MKLRAQLQLRLEHGGGIFSSEDFGVDDDLVHQIDDVNVRYVSHS